MGGNYMTTLKELISEFQSNDKFRQAFKLDPVQACKMLGFDISPEDMIKLQSTLKLKQSDSKSEELEKRKAP
jgi:hypothetical protein